MREHESIENGGSSLEKAISDDSNGHHDSNAERVSTYQSSNVHTSDKNLAGFEKQPESEKPPLLPRLKSWGPWKRWLLYREYHRSEREDAGHYCDQDATRNARGRLPDEEGVQVPAIWVAELYTPSTINGLLKGIADLNWEYGASRRDSLAEWMSNVREGRTAGWINLGVVSPPNIPRLMKERSAPMPPEISAALPILMSLTPSLTAYIIVFFLHDEAAASLEDPLRADFKTHVEKDTLFRPWHVVRYILMDGPLHLSRSISSPNLLRSKAVESRLQELEGNCVQWVRNRFPGAFTALNTKSPTAILLITERAKPHSEEALRTLAFDLLAINSPFSMWQSDEWAGACLVLPFRDNANRLVFSCRRNDAFPEAAGYSNPTSNWTITQRADNFIHGLLSRWAITNLLDSYHHTLSALRDRSARDTGYRPVRDLKDLRSLVRTTLYDIEACAPEIIEFSESKFDYHDDVLEMFQVDKKRGAKYHLLLNFKSWQKERATQVLREATLLRSTLSISSDLSQTISNIRIQRLVVVLTLVSIGVALWAAFLTMK